MIGYTGGSHVGVIGLLMCKALDNVLCCVGYDEGVRGLAKDLRVPIYDSIKDVGFINQLCGVDMVLSVHGREIIPKEILDSRLCINVHPYYYKYKGVNPIGRALEDGCTEGCVVAHIMTDKLDEGEVIAEERITTTGTTIGEIYNELYPLYQRVIGKVIVGMRHGIM